jgi:hypothetical protein
VGRCQIKRCHRQTPIGVSHKAVDHGRNGGAIGFTIDWTLADNSVRTLNQADMIAVGVALGQHVQTQFTKAQALRLQIETASTPEQVAAVVW